MPTFVVSLAVAASLQAGVLAALVVGMIGPGQVGAFAEARLARIILSIDRIARGEMGEKNFIWPVWVSPTLIAPEPWSQWLLMNTDTGSGVHYAQSA